MLPPVPQQNRLEVGATRHFFSLQEELQLCSKVTSLDMVIEVETSSSIMQPVNGGFATAPAIFQSITAAQAPEDPKRVSSAPVAEQ